MLENIVDLGIVTVHGKNGDYKIRQYQCQCSNCGTIFTTTALKKRGKPKEWCLKCANIFAGKKRERHGMHKTKLNVMWRHCKDRCYNPRCKYYSRYGAKGITMCDEWRNSFEAFAKWALANGYKDGLELDKDYLCELKGIHPKRYSPETCRFVPPSVNHASNNREKFGCNCKLSFDDVKYILQHYKNPYSAKELADMFGVDFTTIHYNLKHYRLENNELKRI